jgi:beta-mannosidase
MRRLRGNGVTTVAGDWRVACVEPASAQRPGDLERLRPDWLPARVPGTVAGALLEAGRLSAEQDLDASDFWFHSRVHIPAASLLHFDGLATLAEVWLDGDRVLESRNMFVSHSVPAAVGEHELALRFLSLGAALADKRPRPRFRTRLARSDRLRFFRTTLLGRMPGWSNRYAPVGPWRAIELEPTTPLCGATLRLQTDVRAGQGVVRAELLLSQRGAAPGKALLRVGELETVLAMGAPGRLSGTLHIPAPKLWWPCTHGEPALYPVDLAIDAGSARAHFDCGRLGFRQLELEREGGSFRFRINGVPIFCRGATWTPLDTLTLQAGRADYREALQAVCAAGMNMLRLSGTLVYEDDVFYDLCDELGILLWQDFMFANMDYPADDPSFLLAVESEVTQQLQRLSGRPCLAMLCGGSELEQQPAMLGTERDLWQSPLFSQKIAGHCEQLRPDVPYVTSTPTGGALPFQPNTGVSHYYGVGAYLRPLEDARRAEVRFAAECLAFSNVPEPRSLETLLPNGEAPAHHPAWKQGVPRDHGAGWDFEDVREFYLERLFGVDPPRLRYSDVERWLELGRVTTGEVMAATLAEWRRARSTCAGALIWMLRDLEPGAGFGLVDASGVPKAAYYYVSRALQPQAVFFSDEGLNGLVAHVANDAPNPLNADLSIGLYRDGELAVASTRISISAPARSVSEVSVEATVGRFLDSTYAYRFGPSNHDLVAAVLRGTSGERLGAAFHFPLGLPAQREADVGLVAHAVRHGKGYHVEIGTRRFAQSVSVVADGYRVSDSYFHLEPGGQRAIALTPSHAARPLRGSVAALNATRRASIVVEETT